MWSIYNYYASIFDYVSLLRHYVQTTAKDANSFFVPWTNQERTKSTNPDGRLLRRGDILPSSAQIQSGKKGDPLRGSTLICLRIEPSCRRSITLHNLQPSLNFTSMISSRDNRLTKSPWLTFEIMHEPNSARKRSIRGRFLSSEVVPFPIIKSSNILLDSRTALKEVRPAPVDSFLSAIATVFVTSHCLL